MFITIINVQFEKSKGGGVRNNSDGKGLNYKKGEEILERRKSNFISKDKDMEAREMKLMR